MTDPDPARTPGELFAPWRPRARSGAEGWRLPAPLAEHDLCVRAGRPEDLDALAAISSARNGLPLAEERAIFERRLAPGPLPDVPLVWVAEQLTAAPERRVAAYGTLFHLSDERRRRMAAELGLDAELAHDPAVPGSLVPVGWYLGGLVVDPARRRRGLGAALTVARLAALDDAGVARVRYLANVRNRATLALHEPFGFRVEAEDPAMGGVTFTGGRGHLLVRG